jgi:hypothetical protein
MRYGRPLGGTIKTRFAHLGAYDTANADYKDLAKLFAHLLVDVGCGKGRAINWFLSEYPSQPRDLRPIRIVYYRAEFVDLFLGDSRFTAQIIVPPGVSRSSAILTLE